MALAKQNNSILKKIIETLIKVPFSLASSNDTNDQDIFSKFFDRSENISDLRNSRKKIDEKANDLSNSTGIPTIKKSNKTGVETPKTNTAPRIRKATIINPILSNNNDKNISLFKNDNFLDK